MIFFIKKNAIYTDILNLIIMFVAIHLNFAGGLSGYS